MLLNTEYRPLGKKKLWTVFPEKRTEMFPFLQFLHSTTMN